MPSNNDLILALVTLLPLELVNTVKTFSLKQHTLFSYEDIFFSILIAEAFSF